MPRAPICFIKPMALLPVEELPRGDDWVYELKWDGFRCQALKAGNNVWLWSKNGNDFTDKFPEIADAMLTVRPHTALLDGEIVALDADGRPCFQRLVEGDRRDCALFYYAFDLLSLNGRSFVKVPLEERKAELARLLHASRVRFSASLQGSPARLVTEISSRQLEGIVAKRRKSLYEAGRRSGSWVKWKSLRHDDFIVGGYRPSADGSFDTLLVGEDSPDGFRFVGRVRAGFPRATRSELADAFPMFAVKKCPFVNLPSRTRGRWQDDIVADDMPQFRWLRPGLRLRIGFVERESNGLLRHPKALALTGWH